MSAMAHVRQHSTLQKLIQLFFKENFRDQMIISSDSRDPKRVPKTP